MVRLRFETDMSGTIQAVTSLDKALDKLGDTVTGSTREMNALEKAAKRLVDQNLTPHEKYNQKLETMAKAVKAGKLSMEEATRTADRLRSRLDDTGRSSAKVFDAGAVAKWVAGFVGVQQVLNMISRGFQAVEQQSQSAADNIFQNYGSMAALQAVSGSPEEFAANLAFARDLVSRGVVSPQRQGQGADITKGLVKARLSRAEMEVIADIGQSDLLQPDELVDFAEGVREFRDIFKSKASFRDVASQLIETGKSAKISVGDVGSAATKFGRAAVERGFTGEDALAAYSTILQTSPNARTAASRTEHFFEGSYKMTPDQKALYAEHRSRIRSAASRDVLGTQGGFAATDPLLSATDRLQTTQGELSQVVASKQAEKEILLDLVRAARERQAARFGGITNKLDAWFENYIIGGAVDVVGSEDNYLRGAARNRTGVLNEDERRLLLEYLKRTAESNEQMNTALQAPRPSGRQEQ